MEIQLTQLDANFRRRVHCASLAPKLSWTFPSAARNKTSNYLIRPISVTQLALAPRNTKLQAYDTQPKKIERMNARFFPATRTFLRIGDHQYVYTTCISYRLLLPVQATGTNAQKLAFDSFQSRPYVWVERYSAESKLTLPSTIRATGLCLGENKYWSQPQTTSREM